MTQEKYLSPTEKRDVSPNSLKAWILASRPKTWAAAISPVVVGTAVALHFGKFNLIASLCCLFFAVSMQIAANLINDLVDFKKGTDGEDRLGPLRATAQGWISPSNMEKGILVVVALGCLVGLPLIYFGGWQMILVGLGCVLFAYLYTSGPFPLSYNALGDLAVIVFFGVVAVGFTAYVQMGEWNKTVTYCGVATGLVVNTLLVLNNYRDREQDQRAGKKTSIVLHGEKFGRYLYLFMGVMAVALVFQYFLYFSYFSLPQRFPYLFGKLGYVSAALKILLFPTLICLYFIPHFKTWRKVCQIKAGKKLNNLIGETSRNMLLFALLLSIVLIF